MNVLQKAFSYRGTQVRTVIKDGEPWFVAKDVCDVLGLTNPSESLRALDIDERSTLRISEGGPEVNIINEPGLYSLVIRSNKPEAKEFKRWITHDVIPSIRQTGSYSVKQVTPLNILQQAINNMVEQEQRVKQLENTTQLIKDTVIQHSNQWREDINRMFNRIVDKVGGHRFRELRTESYELLERRARVDLGRRLDNLKARIINEGGTMTAINKANKLDVIEADPKLREIYAAIIKEYTIKYVS